MFQEVHEIKKESKKNNIATNFGKIAINAVAYKHMPFVRLNLTKH